MQYEMKDMCPLKDLVAHFFKRADNFFTSFLQGAGSLLSAEDYDCSFARTINLICPFIDTIINYTYLKKIGWHPSQQRRRFVWLPLIAKKKASRLLCTSSLIYVVKNQLWFHWLCLLNHDWSSLNLSSWIFIFFCFSVKNGAECG